MPEGFEGFTVYFDGGKEDGFGKSRLLVQSLWFVPSRRFMLSMTLLKFVTRIGSPEAAAEWLDRSGAYPEAIPAVYLAA